MNFNKFGQFKMTNTQAENAVGGSNVRNLTAAPAIIPEFPFPINQVSGEVTRLQLTILFDAQEMGGIQQLNLNNQENMVKDVTVNW